MADAFRISGATVKPRKKSLIGGIIVVAAEDEAAIPLDEI
jgi:hypothetical protein